METGILQGMALWFVGHEMMVEVAAVEKSLFSMASMRAITVRPLTLPVSIAVATSEEPANQPAMRAANMTSAVSSGTAFNANVWFLRSHNDIAAIVKIMADIEMTAVAMPMVAALVNIIPITNGITILASGAFSSISFASVSI